MGRARGFLLKHQVATLFRRQDSPASYHRLDPIQPAAVKKTLSRLISWIRTTKAKANRILFSNPDDVDLGCTPVGQGPGPNPIPRGYVWVFVGEKDGEYQRILVPVVYLSHPLFGDLLKESEKEFGFDHPGGIIIPCRISEFEQVLRGIAAGQRRRRKLLSLKRNTGFWMC